MRTNISIPKEYIHGRDNRSQEQIKREGEQINQICQLNGQLFKPLIELESKKQIQKFKNVFLEMKLSGDRFLYYTDRISYANEQDKSNSKLPIILTIHGIPGSLQDFLRLQQNYQSRASCRWINLSIPGLDKKDERRGIYQGYLEDTAILIKDFLDELKVDKVIVIMHSAGGLFGKNFIFTYPERIRASVQIASIGLEMWKPLLQEDLFFKQFGIDVLKVTREEVDQQQFRDKLEAQFKNLANNLQNEEDKNLALWKAITIYEHLILLKAQLKKGGFDSFFANIKKQIKQYLDSLLILKKTLYQKRGTLNKKFTTLFFHKRHLISDQSKIVISIKFSI